MLSFEGETGPYVQYAGARLASILRKAEVTGDASLLDGIYAADSLAAALSLRDRLGAHESVITREGIWVGRSWLRVARDTDARAGVLERERDISRLGEAVTEQAAKIEELDQAVAESREGLRGAEAERDQLQQDYNTAHRAVSDELTCMPRCFVMHPLGVVHEVATPVLGHPASHRLELLERVALDRQSAALRWRIGREGPNEQVSGITQCAA